MKPDSEYLGTQEDFKTIQPMIVHAKEAIGSMGTDTPLAVLSQRPQLLYNYFKQLFAQVTNPLPDGIREEIVTDTSLGINDFNLFDITPNHAKKLHIQNPVISNEDLDKIKYLEHKDFKATSIKALYPVDSGLNGLENALEQLVVQTQKQLLKTAISYSVRQGYQQKYGSHSHTPRYRLCAPQTENLKITFKNWDHHRICGTA